MEHLLVLTERRKINSPDMPELVSVLLDEFEAHKQRGATVATAVMRDALSQGELEQLGDTMGAAEKVILSHPHAYMLAAGPLYPWTTRIASIWDPGARPHGPQSLTHQPAAPTTTTSEARPPSLEEGQWESPVTPPTRVP
ncbi:MAG: hypothetical protein ACRDYY_06260 [Acidimicrobiales bacterium]